LDGVIDLCISIVFGGTKQGAGCVDRYSKGVSRAPDRHMFYIFTIIFFICLFQ
jgi:hypothetical protein